MRLRRDRVHTSESLLSKDSADAGRHIGKLSPAEIKNTRLQDLHATKTVQLSAHNTCNAHSWLSVRKQSCFHCRRRLDFLHSVSFLLPRFWRAYYHLQAEHCFIFFCLNTHCALQSCMSGSTGTEITRGVKKRKQTKNRQAKPSKAEPWSTSKRKYLPWKDRCQGLESTFGQN